MVLCLVVGCSKRSGRDKDVSFHRVPKVVTNRGKQEYELTKKRRAGFLTAISRDGLKKSILENDRICSRHFLGGKPAYLHDETNPDWLPSLHLGHSKKAEPKRESTERWERRRARRETVNKLEAAKSLLSLRESCDTASTGPVEEEQEHVEGETSMVTDNHMDADPDLTSVEKMREELEKVREELERSKQVIRDQTRQISEHKVTFSDEYLANEDIVKFYTGLPNLKVLKVVFGLVRKCVPIEHDRSKLTGFQEFVATLAKLRLNCPLQDLAIRLGVSCSTVSRFWVKWLTGMDTSLGKLILWPEREQLRKTMPECFRSSFGTKVAVIIDCFEIFIERPSNLQARTSTWSSYKHHNTVKVLLGITPQGVVSFVSDPWGGRVSDKYLTEHCGLLDKLLPGDVVLADRGFDIADSVAMMQARLYIPAFTKGKDQLSALEVHDSKTISNVRIHVERVIGCVRQKYSILQSTLPIHFVNKRLEEECPLIDRIVRVSCALNNICDSVIPFN